MQSNIPSDNLTVGFLGTVLANGVPAHVQSGQWPGQSIGGIISADNTEVAYFGRVVSSDPAKDKLFLVGWAPGLVVRGPLLNRQGIRENEPAKPDYILNEQSADAVVKGPLWYAKWGTTVGHATPLIGDIVVFDETDGHIEFLADGGSIPNGWKPLLAAVTQVDLNGNGVEVNFEPQSYSVLPTEDVT